MVDLGNLVTVDYTAAAGATAPATAYANWAAELGVSPTATLYAMDADDSSWAVNFAASPMGSSPVIVGMVSSEGGVGFYKKAPVNTAALNVTTIPNVSRMNVLTDRPDVLFTFHPQADLKSVGLKLQRAGTTTIIGGRVQQYQSTTTPINVADFAMRLNGNSGCVLIVSAPAGDTPVPLYVMDGTVNLSGALMDTVAAGTTRQISASVSYATAALSAARLDELKVVNSLAWTGTPVAMRLFGDGRVSRKNYQLGDLGQGIGRVKGTVKNKGTPSNTPVYRRVRLLRLRDSMAIREQWSDPVTGAYDFQWIDELQDYIVMSLDHTRNFRMVSADYAVVELMP
ncbi:hypothetical protein GNX71_28995 [Variovorax sp. RKNM96]|uniref:hypothetical protein n=1 Tax=Variovorax sp. RKNM96 TaxID=2681552 RepID=UPI0019818720|nr:hypothetical protein [Variovorax sp. RKNM96]QSI33387.1 hypothetical protein GNX71_28995 [Variovorax sp. RKNM96]